MNRPFANIAISTLTLLLTALALLSADNARAQATTLTPSIRYTCSDTTVCDAEGTLYQKVALVNVPSGYASIRIQYATAEKPSETYVATFNFVSITNNECTISFSDANYHYDNSTGYAKFGFILKGAWLSDSSNSDEWATIGVSEPSTLYWHIYGTPRTDASLVAANDPSSIAILNDSKICGYDATIRANSAWASNSTYAWSLSGDNFTIGASGTSTELKQIRFSDGKGASQALSTTITLTQTVGGMCTNTTEKTITMLGMPNATIAREDDINICTSLSEEEDEGRYFDGTIAIEGESPFTATLSTGDVFTNLSSGTNTFSGAHVSDGGRVTLKSVVDVNGCYSEDSYMNGYITVVDRKPHPIFRNDSIASSSRDINVEVEPTDQSDSFEWGVVEAYTSLDTDISGNTYSASITSNMNAVIKYYVIETNEDGTSCSSDTTVLTVDFSMPLKYPNAFSPNGDGRNDKLVIEGLPEENQIFVVNSRGKKVFEATNYRNDWTADGLEDGYYVYVFKGQGTKTVKETLVIKRTR